MNARAADRPASRMVPTALIAVAFALAPACSSTTTPSSDATPTNNGTAAGGQVVFPLPADAAAAIKAAGLPELSAEGQVVHHHAHLDVAINQKPVTVPANIGITRKSISPLHTHDPSGVLHIEAENPDTITLGQFFTEWGVKLDKTCVATYCTDDRNQLLAYVNGQLVADPTSIPITQHANIFIWYGPKGTNPVPPTFDFTGM